MTDTETRPTLPVLALLLVIVLGTPPGSAVEQGVSRTPPLLGGSKAASSSNCGAAGLSPLLKPGRILLLGEIHGTVEGPSVVARVACEASGLGLPVLVALELPVEERPSVDRFLASDGGAAARRDLLAGDFWQRDYQDGRSSAAMLELLDALRTLGSGSARPSVTLLDSARRFDTGQERDDSMGQRLVDLVRSSPPAALIVALTGNVHSRSTEGVPWDAHYRPAGAMVDSRWPDRTLSILLVAPPGQAWICTGSDASSCGPHDLGGRDGVDSGRLDMYAVPEEGHDGSFQLAALTASPPAVMSLRGAGGD